MTVSNQTSWLVSMPIITLEYSTYLSLLGNLFLLTAGRSRRGPNKHLTRYLQAGLPNKKKRSRGQKSAPGGKKALPGAKKSAPGST
jgi:hypothetical protein